MIFCPLASAFSTPRAKVLIFLNYYLFSFVHQLLHNY